MDLLEKKIEELQNELEMRDNIIVENQKEI